MTQDYIPLRKIPELVFPQEVMWEAKLVLGGYDRVLDWLAGSKAPPGALARLHTLNPDAYARICKAYHTLMDQARFFKEEDLCKGRYEIRVLFPEGRDLEALSPVFLRDIILNFRDSEAVSGSRLFTHVEVRKVVIKRPSIVVKQPSISDELKTFIASHTPPVGSGQPRMPKKRLEVEARKKFGERMSSKLFQEAHVEVRGNKVGRPSKTI